MFARRTCEREDQVEMEGGTFEDRPAEWSWTALSPPAGPREWMPRQEMGVKVAMRGSGADRIRLAAFSRGRELGL